MVVENHNIVISALAIFAIGGIDDVVASLAFGIFQNNPKPAFPSVVQVFEVLNKILISIALDNQKNGAPGSPASSCHQ
ncbi:hypothetical protein [Thiolapillus sp.]|uniref:hypothetical protein n=1 Tax=Thiolapillus sp. TaxID=2017437 RepID=UPI0025E6C24D|nr:hypothetical protein [Thiolapillus sp.]